MTPSTTVDASDDQFTTIKQATAGQADNAVSGGKHLHSQYNIIIILLGTSESDKIL